jgi:hypothetical protein
MYVLDGRAGLSRKERPAFPLTDTQQCSFMTPRMSSSFVLAMLSQHYHHPAWTLLHQQWLASLKFDQAVHHIVLEDCIVAVPRSAVGAVLTAGLLESVKQRFCGFQICCLEAFGKRS